MKVEKLVIRKLSMDLKHPFETSFMTQTNRTFMIIEAHGEGLVGYGECVATAYPYYSEETVSTAYSIIDEFLSKLVVGKDFDHPDEFNEQFARIKRNNMAKAGVEGALWDLYAKFKGITLAEALGGKKKEVAVGVSLGIEEDIEVLFDRIDQHLKDGFQKIKVKIKPGKDIEVLRAIRERFGDINLMADANSAYSLADLPLFKEMDKLDLMMIEQPLEHDDIVDHRKLQSELKTPICLDESIHSYDDARRAIELGSCKVINIKIGRVGGLSEAVAIHDLCQKHNIPVWCGGMLESGIGRAHNIAITTLANFTIPGDTSPSSRYWHEDIIEPEVIMNKHGNIAVTDKPGIGYDINEENLKKFTIDTKVYKA
ncbi:o-succinylbenzoate synthase [Sporosarcina sp. P17b]|uniref:o-succinylbenzoate synthase n=1 Tax=Sporosarcina sp. P17b TaxID=2048260 RepID=UPI000C166804|nr:o-succinylbenzoate synthase [Sporosarcina sp. P17b]PIC73666.1 o-succinylbenzoate synthase [Sporosarcina sp. P17b]